MQLQVNYSSAKLKVGHFGQRIIKSHRCAYFGGVGLLDFFELTQVSYTTHMRRMKQNAFFCFLFIFQRKK